METVERWKICLCLFVAVFFTSLENSTEEHINVNETSSDATSLFNVAATTLGLNKSTARSSSGNIAHDTDVNSTVGLPITQSLKNGTDFNNSSENSTISALIQNTEMSELTKKKEMATTVTDGAPPAGNETQVEGSKPTASPTSSSSLNTKPPHVTVVHNVTEKNGHVTKVGSTIQMTRIPQQMETTEKHSIAQKSGSETTTQPKNALPATFTRHEESKELTNAMLTAESETQPVLPTKTMPIAVSSSSSTGISTTTTESTSTNRPRTTHATIETVVTSSTMINKATKLFSTQQSEDSAVNAKKMVNGKPISNPSQSKVDPLVIGMITVFFIIIAIVSLLGFLKYRQRVNQPEFRRLHELPMDDMMEEDTPLSLYSY
ncbi:serine-rich adhesin for platelets-like [Amblyraja radiata]|uniref:serine-rich adhesin for platelets-like n=1 Tax=Amblyraja radiata TaxID=386614 RepID=UPI001402EFCB|nr:serine-rich adhesin for platelets-like [Amblyraja radiata]